MNEPKKHLYGVTLPVTGKAYIEVEAASEEEAIEKALDSTDLTIENIQEWEAVERINEGNVCYAMHPWDAEAEDLGEVEDETR